MPLELIVGLIFWEAWKRFGNIKEVDDPFMLLVAFLGLMANLGSAVILAKARDTNVNVQGAYLHMVADAQKMLKERFGIEHTTLQVEGCDASCGAECQLERDN